MLGVNCRRERESYSLFAVIVALSTIYRPTTRQKRGNVRKPEKLYGSKTLTLYAGHATENADQRETILGWGQTPFREDNEPPMGVEVFVTHGADRENSIFRR